MKKVFIGLCLMLMVLGSFSTSNAWYIEIENVGQNTTIPALYSADLVWHPDVDPGANLNSMFLAVTWNSGASLHSTPETINTYTVGPTTIWEDPGLSHGIDGNILYNIAGSEPLSNQNSFFPSDGALLATVWWLSDPGDVDFTSYCIGGASLETVGIKVNGSVNLFGESIIISSDGSRIGWPLPQVPIPSAVWLLGTGLIGLVGFMRKFNKA